MPSTEPSEDRRGAIADAAIGIIAAQGMRALTHRAIDAELGLPAGSTSYYVRTRRGLIEAVIHRLAHRTQQNVDGLAPLQQITAHEGAAIMAGVVEHLAGPRRTDQIARFALILELKDDPELHALITDRSPLREGLLAGATQRLESMGITDARKHAPALIAVADGLVFDRLAGSGRSTVDALAVFEAYFVGLGARTEATS